MGSGSRVTAVHQRLALFARAVGRLACRRANLASTHNACANRSGRKAAQIIQRPLSGPDFAAPDPMPSALICGSQLIVNTAAGSSKRAAIKWRLMSNTDGPDRPKWVQSVESVKATSFLPLPDHSSNVVGSVTPLNWRMKWPLGSVSGTSAGKMCGVRCGPTTVPARSHARRSRFWGYCDRQWPMISRLAVHRLPNRR